MRSLSSFGYSEQVEFPKRLIKSGKRAARWTSRKSGKLGEKKSEYRSSKFLDITSRIRTYPEQTPKKGGFNPFRKLKKYVLCCKPKFRQFVGCTVPEMVLPKLGGKNPVPCETKADKMKKALKKKENPKNPYVGKKCPPKKTYKAANAECHALKKQCRKLCGSAKNKKKCQRKKCTQIPPVFTCVTHKNEVQERGGNFTHIFFRPSPTPVHK